MHEKYGTYENNYMNYLQHLHDLQNLHELSWQKRKYALHNLQVLSISNGYDRKTALK